MIREPEDRPRDDELFWRRHSLLGLVVSAVACLAILIYARRPGPVPDRSLLTVLALVAMLSASAFWILIRYVGSPARRLQAFFGWSAVTTLLLLVAIHADGGGSSPLASILYLSLMYSSLAYPWPMVLVLGAESAGGLFLVAGLHPSHNTAHNNFLLMGLALGTLMAALAAQNRSRRERDIDALNLQLREQATTDGLAGCLNRRGFDAALEREVGRANRYHRPLTLLMLDLDNLKTINDVGGHPVGDRALQHVTSAMRGVARSSDVIGRLGGDEFAMLLPETELVAGFTLAARLRDQARAVIDGHPITVSIGLAGIGLDGLLAGRSQGSQELLHSADVALYAAKVSGRDRIETFVAHAQSGVPAQRQRGRVPRSGPVGRP